MLGDEASFATGAPYKKLWVFLFFCLLLLFLFFSFFFFCFLFGVCFQDHTYKIELRKTFNVNYTRRCLVTLRLVTMINHKSSMYCTWECVVVSNIFLVSLLRYTYGSENRGLTLYFFFFFLLYRTDESSVEIGEWLKRPSAFSFSYISFARNLIKISNKLKFIDDINIL